MSIFNNDTYKRSHELAKKEVAGRMIGKKSALIKDINLEGVRNNINFILESFVINHKDKLIKEIISQTAVEIIPFGSFNSEICYPPNEPPFILLDSGTLDFLGNNFSIGYALTSDQHDFSEQQILDYLFSSAFIYFEASEEWESRRDAIFTPKLNYSDLHKDLRIHAQNDTISFLIFILLHEFSHLYVDKCNYKEINIWDKLAEEYNLEGFSNFSKQREESVTDITAIDLLLYFTTHCLPKKEMAISILSAIDVGFIFLAFFQSAFPKEKVGKFIRVNEYLDHPAAFQRHHVFRSLVTEKMKIFIEHKGFNYTKAGDLCQDKLFYYSEAIRNGARPSQDFYERRELAKYLFD